MLMEWEDSVDVEGVGGSSLVLKEWEDPDWC